MESIDELTPKQEDFILERGIDFDYIKKNCKTIKDVKKLEDETHN